MSSPACLGLNQTAMGVVQPGMLLTCLEASLSQVRRLELLQDLHERVYRLYFIILPSCLCLTKAVGSFLVLSAHAGSCQPFETLSLPAVGPSPKEDPEGYRFASDCLTMCRLCAF